jgi:hypothetical protein
MERKTKHNEMNTTTMNEPTSPNTSISRASLWTGRVMTGLTALFLLFGAAMNLVKPASVVQGTVKLGYSESVIVPLGIVLLICTILYLVPRTAVLGAILLTGYLGGAVDTHVHAGQTIFEILFPVIFATIVWGGLYLRDPRLRALVPFRRMS